MKLRTVPFPYQAKGVRKIHHFNGRALLADEMGLGKSLQALVYANDTFDAKNPRPVVIVCPASLKWNWEREIRTHLNTGAHVLEGRTVKKFRLFQPFLIVNYDILRDWLPKIRQMKPRLIIVDECHKLGNPSTKQTKSVRQLCRGKSKKIICISGTPLVNRPAELWTALRMLRPDLFQSRVAFEERYCKREFKPWGWQAKGAENLDELHKLLSRTCMVRRLKSEVLSDLPSKTRTIVPLDIANRREYDDAVKDFLGWLLKRKSAAKAKKAAKSEQLTKIGYLKRLAASLKMKAVFEWIDNFLAETDEKIILFGTHRDILQQIIERYKTKAILVDGSTTGQERQRRIDQFNKDKTTRILAGNIKAAGVGWSCTSASVVAFIELAWTPGDHTQAEDRVHGLKRGVEGVRSRAYYLVAHNTIEEELCKILQRKQGVLDGTLDGGDVEESLNICDQLERKLKKGKQHVSHISAKITNSRSAIHGRPGHKRRPLHSRTSR